MKPFLLQLTSIDTHHFIALIRLPSSIAVRALLAGDEDDHAYSDTVTRKEERSGKGKTDDKKKDNEGTMRRQAEEAAAASEAKKGRKRQD